MTPESLTGGFLIGFAAALVLGFLLNLIIGWWRLLNAPRRKQPVVLLTDRTPADVMRAARGAGFALSVVVAFGGLLVWQWFASEYAAEAAAVQRVVTWIIVQVLDVLIRVLEFIRAGLAA